MVQVFPELVEVRGSFGVVDRATEQRLIILSFLSAKAVGLDERSAARTPVALQLLGEHLEAGLAHGVCARKQRNALSWEEAVKTDEAPLLPFCRRAAFGVALH